MKNKTKQKLITFFETLDCDLEIGVATCLSSAYGVSIPEVFTAYEAWQIA